MEWRLRGFPKPVDTPDFVKFEYLICKLIKFVKFFCDLCVALILYIVRFDELQSIFAGNFCTENYHLIFI